MTASFPVEPAETVVLALHYQNENCHPEGKIKVGISAGADWRGPTLAAARRLLEGARARAVPVVHVRLAVRPDYRDVVPNTAVFRQWIELGAWAEGTWGVAFHEGLGPVGDELVVTHTRNDAFHGCPLEDCLNRYRPARLVVGGVSTTFVVESTVRHATDVGYAVTVAADACSTGDRAMHEASLVALRLLATVRTVDDIVAGWGQPAA